ncbi:class I SAM-dependent methyltransferase [Paenibacillus cucumis (ex Kampfer et al. 2016)]|uniref:Methyltransferase domain-containing protein n=1 Tax=Paenibacillus cucumis (ex Kampfer et al. 2016) TaxID=1776858 RepID=A0ABS7KRU5_9BACL|nr:class I SAM-dependent methyltransferase [Paenibacillus cucumis (ex Kampfer et al. 2016)]MBY0206804.1 methyltransferase domain-containing protein [Paenibacillus cucumis (ex Kampfer et al. 2016)]
MDIFPEVIGIQLSFKNDSNEVEYIPSDLINILVEEIKRWPTIKIIEFWYNEETDLLKCEEYIKKIESCFAPPKIITYLKTPTFFDYSFEQKKDYYEKILTNLGYEEVELENNKQLKSRNGLGEFALETNSLFVLINGLVTTYRRSPLPNDIIGEFPENDFGSLLNNKKVNELRKNARILIPDNDGLDYLNSICSSSFLELFWRKKDSREEVNLLDERIAIYRNTLMIPQKAVRIDLGCGTAKRKGFIGVDRFLLPGVDIAADLNKRLPFEDNSVDLVYASHSLEHVQDLMFTMNEIYRICRHGAQVCIVVPYSEQKLNYANPYHLQVFNEHTPRFWTDYPESFIPKEEWVHPQGPYWGLSRSDHSAAIIDLRCIKMHFDYFPEYWDLSDEQKLAARKSKIDVCEQVMYHLISIKEETTDEEFTEMVQKMEYYEPPYMTIRKQKEEHERLSKEISILKEMNGELKEMNVGLIKDSQRLNEQIEAEYEKTNATIQKLRIEQEKSNGIKNSKDEEIQQARDMITDLHNSLKDYEDLKSAVINLANEKEAFHRSKLGKLKKRITKTDYWDLVGKEFSDLKDDSVIFGFKKKGYNLELSENLQDTPFIHYKIFNTRGVLKGVYIALSVDFSNCKGHIGIEILNSNGTIIENSSIMLNNINAQLPVYLPTRDIIFDESESYYIRIFGSGLEIPVKVYEFKKGSNRNPFFSLDFYTSQ